MTLDATQIPAIVEAQQARPATAGSPATSPVADAQSAIDRMIQKNFMGVDQAAAPSPSNPGGQAAAGATGQTPATRQWSDADMQAAQAYLGRFQAPPGALDGKLSRDDAIQWGLNLAEMQKGITAKTKAQEARISELEQALVKAASGPRKGESEGRKPKDDQRAAAIKALADELGVDVSKIGPALEQLIPTPQPEENTPAANGHDELLREVRGLAVQSARTQLSGMFPALQHDALYADVLDDMQSLNGPRYNALPRGERELAKMRDACTLRFGAAGVGPDKTQARGQVLQAQIPRPQGGSVQHTGKPANAKEHAEQVLTAHGLLG